nr:Asp-tRNA(Asn)/Glu-tRNA(Gln) amidotransferase GatCAB subunit A [Gammaproteobacteria bacterium]
MRLGRIDRREALAGIAAVVASARFGSALAQSEATEGDPTELTLLEASRRIRAGALSPVELTRAYLAAIERLEPRINAFITITGDLALERARALEAELEAGRWRGPLHGVPIALKDNIDTAGIRTTAAGAVFAERVPDADAEVWRRLEAAGAILLGKLNMHEYAYGGTSSITHFEPVHNPWNLDHIPGGSSGGSAAAVAARMCAAALGTDTLASIRLPAAYCGVVGLKPTHGLASIRGIIPVSESLDHVGPLARTVGDAAAVLGAIAGYDPLDPVSRRARVPDYLSALFRSPSKFRVGLPREPYFEDLHADVAAAVDEAIEVIRRLTAEVRDVTLPPPSSFPELLAEAYAYHRPFLDDPSMRGLYDPVTLERLLAAGEFSTVQYYEARRALALARNAIEAVFDEVDLVVTPTAPGLPEAIRDAQNPAEASGAEPSVRNTYPFNIYGIPTISVPCGFSRSGLPIGLQISGPAFGELDVLTLAHAYEQATDWHRRRPPL